MKRKLITLLIAICVLCAMSVPTFGAENPDASKLSNPRVTEARPATWDCIWFGNYPQSLDGKGGYNNDPIKWRVLSVEGDEALLLADKSLDVKKYNEQSAMVTWETSTIRSWLNGYDSNNNRDGEDYAADNFIDQAFSPEEQDAIYQKAVENMDEQEYGVKEGNSTEDKMFLLSMRDVLTPAYGFPNDYDNNSRTRIAKETAYTQNKEKTFSWWLRSPSNASNPAGHVNYTGTISRYGYVAGGSGYSAIRPALRINLTSELWAYAGTVCSDGSVNEIEKGMSDTNVTLKKPIEPQAISSTWDCVWFGHYLQGFDENGEFQEEPIKWRVLSVKGDEALLLADKNLDARQYNEIETDVTWDTSTVRSWLNGYDSKDNQEGIDYTADNFINQAFTPEEQKFIYQKTIENSSDSSSGTEGGNTTKDKIFLLSTEEAKTLTYGFPSDYNDETRARRAENTAYINGKVTSGSWWLRSSSYGSSRATDVYRGAVHSGVNVDISSIAIRPALYLNLNSDLWTYAGIISSDDPLDYITATKSKVKYKVNENLNIDDLVVTASYIDATKKKLTNYTTNVAKIDMATPGRKKLIITYQEGSVPRTCYVDITVEQQSVNSESSTSESDSTSPSVEMPTTAQSNEEITKPAAVDKQAGTVAKFQGPKKVTLKKAASTKKGILKLTWKRDTKATGYQAMVAIDKKFKKNKKTATIKKNKTVSKTFTKLKRKKTYYAKVRAYKQVGKKKVYGSYSKVKKARVK